VKTEIIDIKEKYPDFTFQEAEADIVVVEKSTTANDGKEIHESVIVYGSKKDIGGSYPTGTCRIMVINRHYFTPDIYHPYIPKVWYVSPLTFPSTFNKIIEDLSNADIDDLAFTYPLTNTNSIDNYGKDETIAEEALAVVEYIAQCKKLERGEYDEGCDNINDNSIDE